MKLVYICSKLRGDMEHNIKKAHEYCRMAAEISLARQNDISVYQIIVPDNPLCYPGSPLETAEIMALYA